jgi:hypothetical protein
MEEASPCPTKVEDKDLLEPDKLKPVANLQMYQVETKAWRDTKLKQRAFDMGDLVLSPSPRTESSEKLESKWVRPYVAAEKSRPGVYRLLDSQGKMLEHSWNANSLRRFYV